MKRESLISAIISLLSILVLVVLYWQTQKFNVKNHIQTMELISHMQIDYIDLNRKVLEISLHKTNGLEDIRLLKTSLLERSKNLEKDLAEFAVNDSSLSQRLAVFREAYSDFFAEMNKLDVSSPIEEGRFNAVLKAFDKNDMVAIIESVELGYFENYEEQDALSLRYGALIFAVATFLILYLGLLFFKLLHTKQKLEKLNQELEIQMTREEELKQMIRAINDSSIVAITDLQGKILDANDNFSHISGYSKSELLGQDHRILNSGHHSKEFFKGLWNCILGGNTWSGEIRNRAKDGSYYWVQTLISPLLDGSGKIHKFISVRFDITKSKNDDAKILEQQAKLVSSARLASLGEMAGSIAHEINNPLGIVGGKADQMLRLIKDDRYSKEKTIADLERILAATDRIAKIVKGMRTFSRNGEKDPFDEVKVAGFIDDVLGLCQERFVTNNIALNVNVKTEGILRGQVVQIGQVLLNLLNNALDAVSVLPEKWVSLDVTEQGDMIQFRVTDAGPGIAVDLADKIMQPFFTTKQVGKGTGLGLSIAKNIVEDHKGRLWIDSQQNHTCFVVEIPRVKEVSVKEEKKI